MEDFGFALSVTGPVFLIMIFGYLLNSAGVLQKQFAGEVSRFVLHVTLPALLFFNIFTSQVSLEKELPLVAAGVLGTLITIPLVWFLAQRVSRGDRATFIHGAFRGNMAIIGLAWVENAYGFSGLAQAELLIAFIVIIYNVAAVLLFTCYSADKDFSWKLLVKKVGRNPLILSVILGLLLRESGWRLPQVVLNAGMEVGSVTLPMALLCIGASFDFDQFRIGSMAVFGAVAIKLLLVPIVLITFGLVFHLEPQAMGVLLLLATVPSASVSFVIAQAMGGNSQMAANIVGLSTLLSVAVASFGMILIKVFFE